MIGLEGLNAVQPALITSAGGTVTLVEGGTFCLSDATGDVRPGTAHGGRAGSAGPVGPHP